jgi:hypothetical protein
MKKVKIRGPQDKEICRLLIEEEKEISREIHMDGIENESLTVPYRDALYSADRAHTEGSGTIHSYLGGHE